jgi:Gpi18-like mannosyltransferase
MSLTKKFLTQKFDFRDFDKPARVVLAASIGLMYFLAIAFFSQRHDISHTVLSSYGYLNGKIFEFYDYNKIVLGGNDYLPPVYIIFAIWMAPLFYSGLSSAPELTSGPLTILELLPFELLWAKFALIAAFVLSVFVFYKVASLIFKMNQKKTNISTISFATSPLAFFAVGIFNQYDVFGVLFTLLGLLFLLKGRILPFTVLFGLAASFKFFALILVVPLILLYIPTWISRLKAVMVVAFIPLVFALPYISSVAFQEGVLRLVYDRGSSGSFLSVITFAFTIYAGINLWALHVRKTNQDLYAPMVIISIATYALLFNSVTFNPQWLIIVSPFLALAVGYVSHPKLFLFVETVAFAAFAWYVLVSFTDNVDGTMVMNGPLSSIFGNPQFPVSVFFPPLNPVVGLLIFKVILLALPVYVYLFRDNKKTPDFGVGLTSVVGARALAPLLFVLIPSLIAVMV